MWMLKNSFGETLLHNSASLVPSFQIMDSNLTIKPSEDTIANWRSLTGTQLLAYPQGNGQAKVVNKVIVNGLKKRLDDAKGRWVEELSHVL